MEEKQIGRPSTTAGIFKLLKDRKYITGGEGGEKLLKITELGENVGVELMKEFNQVINLDYTIKMEEQIDQIANGSKEYVKNLDETNRLINSNIKNTGMLLEKTKESTNKKCPKCGKDLLVRHYQDKKTGKDKIFYGCSNYPKCKYSEFLKDN
jgi:DNA topoisomerase-1